MTLVQNLLQQLSGNKRIVILALVVLSVQSCGSLKKPRRTVPKPPPAVEEDKPTTPADVEVITEKPTVPEVKDTVITPQPPVVQKEQINLAIMLPFQLDNMDASGSIPRAAQNSLELYKGIQYALDEAYFANKELNVYVIDNAGDDETTRAKLQQNPFPDVDAVIGPLYTKSFKLINDFAKQNEIPFISPLSSSKTLASNNPYIISLNATSDTRYSIMLDFIEREFVNPNIGVLYQPVLKEKKVRQAILNIAEEKGITVKDQVSEGRDMFVAVDNLLEKGRENVIITGVDDNEEGQLYFNRLLTYLNQVGGEHDIKLIATREWNDVQAVVPSLYPNVSVYILDRFLDPTNSPKSAKFSQLQAKNNNRPLHIYNLQGYDIMTYLLTLMNQHGKEFEKYITKEKFQGVQSSYQFDEYKTNGGVAFYDNKYINILQYRNGRWEKMN